MNWDDIEDLDELIEKMKEDKPHFQASMARIRGHIDRGRRYLGWSEEEIRRAWDERELGRR